MRRKKILPLFFLSLLILAFWKASSLAIPIFVPSPITTIKTLILRLDLFLYHLPYTFLVAIGGLTISLILSFLLAVPMQLFKAIDYATLPWVIIFQAIPFIALGPLILAIFGYGIMVKIYTVTLLCYFPIFLSLYEGMRNIQLTQLKLLQSLGYSPFQILLKLYLPSALPHIFTGIRTCISWIFSAAILAEFLGTERGMGLLIETAVRNFDNALVFAALILITLLSLFLFFVSKFVQNQIMPWYKKK